MVAAAAPASDACRDCGHALPAGAAFCPQCGQETQVRLPRVFDFLREAADETIGLSGRLPRTLTLLLFRPGRLTMEYIEGRRQRYVRPMRLYLSVSLVFFGVLGLATSDVGWLHLPGFDDAAKAAEADSAKERRTKTGITPKPATKETGIAGKDADLPATEGGSAAKSGSTIVLPEVDLRHLDTTRKAPAASTDGKAAAPAGDRDAKTGDADMPFTDVPCLKQRIEHYRDMPQGQVLRVVTQGMQANAPYAVFILMPLAALWYQFWYLLRRRRYAEHLLHAVHLHCFAFCIGLLALLPLGNLGNWRGWLFILLGVYAVMAERRVYRSGWLRAMLGTFIGSVLYVIGVAFTAAGLAIMALAF